MQGSICKTQTSKCMDLIAAGEEKAGQEINVEGAGRMTCRASKHIPVSSHGQGGWACVACFSTKPMLVVPDSTHREQTSRCMDLAAAGEEMAGQKTMHKALARTLQGPAGQSNPSFQLVAGACVILFLTHSTPAMVYATWLAEAWACLLQGRRRAVRRQCRKP